MIDKKNYYQILNVSPLASSSAIKKSYRKLARTHHPDKNQGNPDAEVIFKQINEAYQVLGDSFKRKVFDKGLKKEAETQKPAPMYSSYNTYPKQEDTQEAQAFYPQPQPSPQYTNSHHTTSQKSSSKKQLLLAIKAQDILFHWPIPFVKISLLFIKKRKK